MKAEIITSGTELLLGEIADTNTAFIARQLAGLGINLYYTSTVGDNFERYLGVLKHAWDRSDIIITTGGLGPTQGDITREVISTLLGENMAVDPDLKEELIQFFARVKIDMPENNLKQATLIPSAQTLHNTAGTAPGWWIEKEGRTIIVLPGPPREMQTMWQNAVYARLEKKRSAYIMSRVIKTWGMPEASVDQLVSPFLKSANPTLAMYANPDGIRLRITARADTVKEAKELVAGREHDLRELLKDRIWGADDDTLEGVAAKRLLYKKKSLAVAETFTGGQLARSLSSVKELKDLFRGGLVIMNSARSEWGLDKYSAETAAKLASLAREKFTADIGLAIDGPKVTGQVVPGDKMFIAIDGGGEKQAFPPGYLGRPDQVAWRTVNHALILLKDFIDRT